MPKPKARPASNGDAFFESSAQKRVGTSAGGCELPIQYKDASLLGVVYRVDPARARLLIDSPAVEPLVALGKAVVLLCAFEYRDTSIGPYAEVGLGILTRRRGSRSNLAATLLGRQRANAALFVVNLPVTTEAARAAGVEIWGYPKYVTTIETSFGRDRIRVGIPREFELSIRRARGIRTRGVPFVTYSVASGRLLRTVTDVDHSVKWTGAKSVELRLHGEGPMATNIEALGLSVTEPSFAFGTDRMRSLLPFGEDLGAAV